MNPERRRLPAGEAGYFFVVVNFLVGIAMLMAAISIGVMFYGGLQLMGR